MTGCRLAAARSIRGRTDPPQVPPFILFFREKAKPLIFTDPLTVEYYGFSCFGDLKQTGKCVFWLSAVVKNLLNSPVLTAGSGSVAFFGNLALDHHILPGS